MKAEASWTSLSDFPPIWDTTILDTEWEERDGYRMLVPTSTSSGLWRSTFLFLDLDDYGTRIDRYRQAFVVAIVQPELMAKLKDNNLLSITLLRNFAENASQVLETGSEAAELASILKSGQGVFDLTPISIQTTLFNFQEVAGNKHLSQSLGSLGEALGAVSLAFKISADTLDDIFLHTITNARTLERMEYLEDFVVSLDDGDPALTVGFLLAQEDVNQLLSEDTSAITAALNSFEDHGAGYLIEAAQFVPAIASHFHLISSTLAKTISRVVLPYYLAYAIGVPLFADLEGMQTMCAAATLNEALKEWEMNLEADLPAPGDLGYQEARRRILTAAEMRYALGYHYHAKYDEILSINAANPADWIQLLTQFLSGSWPSVQDFRTGVLWNWMSYNYSYAVTTLPYLDYQLDERPRVVAHRNETTRGANIYITFNEDMDQGSFTASTISVSGSSSGDHSTAMTFYPATYELMIESYPDFAYGETVSVAVGTGVKDLSGKTMASPYAFSFVIESAPSPAPTSLNVAATLDPPTVPAYTTVHVAGTVVYATGASVTAGSVEINTGENLYTAAIQSGSFTRDITAPGSSRSISITAHDSTYGLSATIQRTISIEGEGNTSGYDLTTDVVYDYVDNGDSVEWFSKDAFRTTDEKVDLFAYFSNLNLDHNLDLKWRYYYPDGSQYGDDLVWNDAILSDWDWGWASWGFYIDNHSMASHPGRYRIKFYVDGDKKATHYYVVAWDFTEHRLAKDVQSADPFMPVNETNVFYQTDTKALTWANFDMVAQSGQVKHKFYEPNGSLYSESTPYTLDDPGTPHTWWDWYRVWGWININGASAANKTGQWRAECWVQNPATGVWEQYYSDYFQILESPAQAPAVTVSASPAGPVETTSITLNVSATDNTYLRYATLYWNDGTLHSQNWDNIFAGSLSQAQDIGPYSGGQQIEYWAVALDTSGNQHESEHRTVIVAPETVSQPNRPTGSSIRQVGQSGSYVTGDAATNLGHAVEYQFDWGDGQQSAWGGSAQPYSWNSQGIYLVKARARCQAHTGRVSEWSAAQAVTVDSTAPIVEISTHGGMGFTTTQTQVILAGTAREPDPASGLASIAISTASLNEGTLSNWRFTADLADGLNTLAITAADQAGNHGQNTVAVTRIAGVSVPIEAGWNLISVPLNSDTAQTAESLCDAIGSNAIELDRWIAGGWDSHVCGLPFNDFPIEMGMGYFVKSTGASAWNATGTAPTGAFTLNLMAGWNLVGLPHGAAYTAESLGDAINAQGGACTEIDRWYAGGWDSHIIDLPFNDFAVDPGLGYFVKCQGSSAFALTLP